MTVGVVVDSSAVVPADEADRLGMATVPIWLHLDGSSYRDGIDIEAGEFYRRLEQGADASTSAPSPGDFLTVYRQVAPGRDALFVVTVSAALSAVYDAARSAAERFEGVPVVVFDSGTAATAAGLVAVAAAEAAATGAELAGVEADAERVAERVDLVATLDTFRYLRRSGRVNLAEALMGEALHMKPLFRLRRGKVSRAGLTTSRATAVRKIALAVMAGEGRLRAAVFHAADPARAGDLVDRIRSRRPDSEVSLAAFSPAMGAHTGPGVVGASWWYS